MITIIDSVIIIGYFLLLITMGWFFGRKNKNQEDYFLAGRTMSWLPIGLSVAATMISANGFVGGPGWAYSSGIKPYMVNIGVPFATAFIVFTTIPLIYNLKLTSVYKYVELRLGIYSRMLSVFGFIVNSLIQISSMVLIPALILQALTGWKITVIIPVVVIISIAYTLLGGIKAVIWTDTIQMIVIWFALLFSIGFILNKLDMSFFETIKVAKTAGKLKALNFDFNITNTHTIWAATIGGTLMWIRYFGFDQGQVQRILTAKSIRTVKKSFLLSALVMNILYFLMMIAGVMLFVFFKGKTFTTSNNVMIEFITKNLPVGVIGIVVAGVFAAAMSSIDSLLNSMSTSYTKDIHERFFVKDNKQLSLKKSMIVTTVWGLVVILITIFAFVGTTKSILEVVGSYISYISGPMLGVFFLSAFTYKAHDKGVALGTILGFIFTFAFSKITKASWIWNPAVGMIATFTFGYILSMILPRNKKISEIKKYTVVGQRQYLIEQNDTIEDGVSKLPLTFDRYVMWILAFFLIQYFILWFIGK